MDHLPQPAHPYKPIEIRYLDGSPYDDQDFATFPQRAELNPEALLFRGAYGAYDPARASEFLQEWLWFGMLSECLGTCGIRVLREDFIRSGGSEEGGGLFLTTTELPGYLAQFRDAAERMDAEAQDNAVLTINGCLRRVDEYLMQSWALEKAEDMYQHQDPFLDSGSMAVLARGISRSPLTPEIQLSVEVLKAALAECSDLYFAKAAVRRWTAQRDMNCRFLIKRAVEHGWCPSMALATQKNFGNVVLYYATLLEPQATAGKDHTSCPEDRCPALDIGDGAMYKQLHACGAGDCVDFEPDEDEIGRIIDAGGIPLIYLCLSEWAPESCLLYGVCEYEPGRNYTAISHVWSDGLGNPARNAIPTCQLMRLRKLISAIQPQGQLPKQGRLYFWLDTLCCPVRSATRRKTVIKQMSQIYRQAAQVLVLDSTLTAHALPPTAVEILMRILVSNWHHRLWTLQEGVVSSKNLWIQFNDKAVRFNSFPTELKEYTLTIEGKNPIRNAVTQLYISYFHLNLNETTGALFRVASATRTRSTSKASDEALCLSSILGMDVAAVVEAPDNLRMQALFLLKHQVSPGIIFLKSPKLATPGFRWAPATFLTSLNEFELYDLLVEQPGNLALVTKEGLRGRFDITIRLGQMNKLICSPLWVQVPQAGLVYRANILEADDNEKLKTLQPSTSLSLIVGPTTLGDTRTTNMKAVLVADCRLEAEGVVAGRYVCVVHMELMKPPGEPANVFESLVRTRWEKQQKGEFEVDEKVYTTCITGSLMGDEKEWLIS